MNTKRWLLPLLTAAVVLLPSACAAQRSADASESPDGGADAGEGIGADGGGTDQDGSEWGLDLSTPDESINYGIYVGAIVNGQCDPDTNNGGFQFMTFDSAFHQIVFVRPGSKKARTPYGGMYKADVPGSAPLVGIGILGEGEMGDFTLCPENDGRDCACHVTNGPNPFEPNLSLQPEEEVYGIAPSIGTPEPNNLGYAVLFYSIGGTKDLGPILEWSGCVGSHALGGDLEPVTVEFLISWDKLMAGEEFADSLVITFEGEKWEWSIRFVPGY